MKKMLLSILLLTFVLKAEEKQQKIPDTLFYGVSEKKATWIYVAGSDDPKTVEVFLGSSKDLKKVRVQSVECEPDGGLTVKTDKGTLIWYSPESEEEWRLPVWGNRFIRIIKNYTIIKGQKRVIVALK
jgi:hypothetical protein